MSGITLLGAGMSQPPSGAATDPNWASVVLLAVNDNAGDATTTFIDQSTSAKTITAVGNVQYDTAQAPTGMTSSALFDGTGDRLTLAANGDFTMGTGDVTWEGFVRFASVASSGFICAGDSVDGDNWFIVYNNSLLAFRFGFNDVASAYNESWTPSADTWYHWALCRSGNSWRSFIDGTQVGSTRTDAGNLQTSDATVAIGAFNDGVFTLNGWHCSVRVTKGVARYTANFTPPTLPLPTS